ncbi:MAG: TVP38/TMEM64 family protein [Myxococcota bacterium]
MNRRRIGLLGFLLLLVVVFYSLRRSLGLELDPESMQHVVADMGIWAPLAYVGIVAFRVPLGLPSAIVLVGGGAVFGTLAATLYGTVGIVLSASFLFFAARATGSDSVMVRLPRMRPFFELAGSRIGGLVLIVGTGYPMGPATLFHFVAGVTPMAFLTFLLAAAVGALIRSGVYTFFGSRLVEGDLGGLLQATALFTAAALVPLLFPRSRAWLLESMGRRPPTTPDA